MDSLFLNLANILKRQHEAVEELLEIARRHNLALRQNDMTDILATANKQEELSRKLSEQDKRREGIQRKLAEKYGLDGRPALKNLLPYTSGAAAVELGEISRSLRESLAQVGEIKDLNCMLARSGQAITGQLLESFRLKSWYTYAGSGRMKDRGKLVSIMDKTI